MYLGYTCIPKIPLFYKSVQQLAILRAAGASHGDVKPDNIMFTYKDDDVVLDSADIHIAV